MRRSRSRCPSRPGIAAACQGALDDQFVLELALPPGIAAEQVKGFSLYSLRAVMSGRGEEVVELAKAKLLR